MVLRAEEIRNHLRNTGKRLKYERGAGEEGDAPGTPAKSKSKEFKAEAALGEELAHQSQAQRDQYDVDNGKGTVKVVHEDVPPIPTTDAATVPFKPES